MIKEVYFCSSIFEVIILANIVGTYDGFARRLSQKSRPCEVTNMRKEESYDFTDLCDLILFVNKDMKICIEDHA